MLDQASLFLVVLLAIALMAKNKSLIIAVAFLLIIKWVGLGDRFFPLIQKRGIEWGVIIITVAVLIPIATGEIGFKQLGEAMKSYYGWIALGSGIAVALIAASGIKLLTEDPHITTTLVIGTILAVSLFNGIAVGPLIGAGIAYLAIRIVQLITG
ncbi:DUF441 domain-containing protein [Alkalihalobacillus sp. AL-G]|uniref:DUF441 domain-containing protein n=1 Tax=Alkalihalobacillus sp. AL-G TaxID=2926399 RepID=UPI00272A5D37|nr:DUF441 domain-containing protein [Alkalihalobacillus sp. AL-G]WLD92347.1 DUF441 domain-containing protein [Alkalihalobacillus sp. AL-G]